MPLELLYGVEHFNPRSLAGATDMYWPTFAFLGISIHAPLRERLKQDIANSIQQTFQSTLPCGSDDIKVDLLARRKISIHAPLRERHKTVTMSP